MKKRLMITVAIAAYNSQENIVPMLRMLVKQHEETIVIAKIIVYSDASHDRTVLNAKTVEDKRIRVIDGKIRKGFAEVVKFLLKHNQTEIIVLLNDDIAITDHYFIQKLVTPFGEKNQIGLVTGNPQPLPSDNFIANAIISSFKVYETMKYEINNGDNVFNCDGKVLALSKKFANQIRFPVDNKYVANVDSYLYFSCRISAFRFRNVKEAKVFFKCPTTIRDYISWSTRNNSGQYLLKKTFGSLVDQEFNKFRSYPRYVLAEFINNPLGCLFIFCVGRYIKYKARHAEKLISSTWETVNSTKGLVIK